MVIKVGINSFGRIGRVIFRTCCQNSEIEVAAINDPAIDLEYMCYLIKFDSTHGKYTGNVSYEGNEIKINDTCVKVFHHKVPSDIPWHEAGVQYVVEASGMFTSLEKASGHITSEGVRRVIVTAPSADAPMLILGVNDDRVQPETKVVSCASSTLYCLAPIVKVLHDTYGIAEGFVTSIHAMTPSLKPLDGLCVRGKHWRDHRSIHQNIIPTSTGACKALGKIIPSCKDKLAGLAFRVPIVNVSLLDMSIKLNNNTTIAGISEAIENIKNPALQNIIKISSEKAVSSDFIGDRHSCTLDIDSSMQITPNFFKLICWYENEYSYSCRVVDTVLFLERQLQAQIPLSLPRLSHTRPLPFKTLERLQHAGCSDINRNRESIPFRVLDTLQDSRSNIKRGSHSLIMKPSITHGSPIYQVGRLAETRNRDESIKSYIDKFTKCNCNAVQNKTHSLKTFIDPPAGGNECAKAQDRIKKVEKEISEMLNMTEDLLNKSSNKKNRSCPPVQHVSKEAAEKELSTLRENIIAKISDTIEKIRKEKKYACNNHVCGDHKSLVLDVDDYHEKSSASKHEMDSLNNSNIKLEESVSSTKMQVKNVVSPNVPQRGSSTFVIKKFNYSCDPWVPDMNLGHILSKTVNKSHITDDLKLQIAKENKALIKGKTEQVKKSLKDDRADFNEKGDLGEDFILIISDNLEPANPQDSVDLNETFLKNNNDESERISHNEVKNDTSLNDDQTENELNISDLEIVRKVEVLAKNNIKQDEPVAAAQANALHNIGHNDNNVRENSRNNEPLDLDNISRVYPGISGCSSNQTLSHKYVSNTIDNNSEESSMCVPSDYECTSASESKKTGGTYRNIDDIYDKLDSNSVSESENSFQIHEKISQVINITDLTYSLEDLSRLDKICRVIEISDELSDKLFSPLDNEHHQNKTGQKWSFQDLCERIKFDEFCNELFEKSAF